MVTIQNPEAHERIRNATKLVNLHRIHQTNGPTHTIISKLGFCRQNCPCLDQNFTYHFREPDETDDLTENDEIGESIVSHSQHGMTTYKDKNYPPAVLSSTSMDSIDNNNIKDTVNKPYNETTTKWTSDGSSGYDPEAGSQLLSNVKTASNRTERETFIEKKTSQDRKIPGKLLSNRTSNSNNSIQGNRSVTGSSSHRSNQLQSVSNSRTTFNRQLETYNKKDQIKGIVFNNSYPKNLS